MWEARTGAEALARAHEGPDVVMLDIKLPDITGLEVCRRLKQDPATAGIPVLQMTATFGSSEMQAAALEGGADAYLTHPVEPIVLVATLRSLLRAREAETRARRLTAWWQSTFDAIQDGVMLLSRSGQVLRCNRAMAEMLGRSPEAIVGDAGLPALARRRAARAATGRSRAPCPSAAASRATCRWARAGSRSWPTRCSTRAPRCRRW